MKRHNLFISLECIILLTTLIVLASSQALAGQCAATTKKGTQCKRNAQSGSVYCWQHEGVYGKSTTTPKSEPTPDKSNPAAPSTSVEKIKTTAPVTSGRCQATTKKGTQCSRKAQAGSNYCWQHGR